MTRSEWIQKALLNMTQATVGISSCIEMAVRAADVLEKSGAAPWDSPSGLSDRQLEVVAGQIREAEKRECAACIEIAAAYTLGKLPRDFKTPARCIVEELRARWGLMGRGKDEP
jgi:hypothetical protein